MCDTAGKVTATRLHFECCQGKPGPLQVAFRPGHLACEAATRMELLTWLMVIKPPFFQEGPKAP